MKKLRLVGILGVVLALAIWIVAQDVGQLYSGQATDPNTALIIAILGVAILGSRRTRVGVRVRTRGRVSHRDLGEASAASS